MKTKKIKMDNKTPTFVVQLWHSDNYPNMEKHYIRRMFSGSIEFVQTKEIKMFSKISEMLSFMEKRRV